MTDPGAAEAAPAEEVAFWRGFIVWWAREKTGPVPPRAWEALAQAELAHGRASGPRRGPVWLPDEL